MAAADGADAGHRRRGETPVGGAGFHAPDWERRIFEVGYWLRAGALGRGDATEAVRRLVELAFGELGARRVAPRCDARNGASWGVGERTGFVSEGRLRDAFAAPDGAADDLVFALMPGDVARGRLTPPPRRSHTSDGPPPARAAPT